MGRNRSEAGHCRECGRERGEGERFSSRGLCRDCGARRLDDALERRLLSDPDRLLAYRRGVARSVGAILPEDLPGGSPQ